MKKWLFLLIGIMVVGYIGYQWYSAKAAAKQAPITQMRTADVQKGKLEVKVSGSGTIQPVTSEDIKSTVNNKEIDEVLVSTNETVKKGDELITFTDGSDSITAPADGIITSITATAGQRVNSGEVVAHLTNYTNLETIVQIDELDIPKIKMGQSVTLKVNAFPDQSYTGKVTEIANEGTATNGVSSFDVTIQISNVKDLKVGMSTEANILTASKENALYVPLEAVHTRNGEKFVIIGNDENTVKTGLFNEDYIEITEGLVEGETVKLPQLAINNTSINNSKGFMGGGGFGGMNRMNRNGGGAGQGVRGGN
ncbi:MAG TPA: efflux RND transporter periplasmic adaptor subunit [Bacillales bacterium]|nr:efflux RND transporter periplasmic adaptor subunit [Bacillales bacterium]